ncbi:hypothetical protein NC99_23650 [Sunxiuqinia dokdonensis]|uniref:Uncharacterized protein n=1 Tax=Sunxiuqinia dokdonensis TaxID=1409788 RepID=A0A0L8V8Y7_9BACT|nr:hypothetical protein NC99_23650 [Sunxiuqinia dokdonensis]
MRREQGNTEIKEKTGKGISPFPVLLKYLKVNVFFQHLFN